MAKDCDGAIKRPARPSRAPEDPNAKQQLAARYRHIGRAVLPLYEATVGNDGVGQLETGLRIPHSDKRFAFFAASPVAHRIAKTVEQRLGSGKPLGTNTLAMVRVLLNIDPNTVYDSSVNAGELIGKRLEAWRQEIDALEAQVPISDPELLELWACDESADNSRVLN